VLLPSRAYDRKLKLLPMCTKSNTDIDEPSRAIPKTERVEPNLAKQRQDKADPSDK
jgi:hypothetical protein